MSQQKQEAENLPDELRAVLIAVAGGRLLLPNVAMAEIITLSDPEPVAEAPPWLLGRVRWHGWRLPVIAFGQLAGIAHEGAQSGSKLVVLKALGGNPKLSYFAVLTQGFPRLVRVERARLQPILDDASSPLGVRARVHLNDETAMIPDMSTIEMLIDQVLAGTAA